MIDQLVQPVSTYASDIDWLIAFIGATVGFWFLLTFGMFVYLIWQYRYKEGVKALYVTGEEPHLKRWITIPHAIIILFDVGVIVFAIQTWYNIKQHLPEPGSEIRIVGQQWAWTFVHPGLDNKLGTDDDIQMTDELRIASDTVYHFKLESRDVLHSFSVPVFRLKQDAIPGREITGWFEATEEGVFDIQCAEMCGIGHGIMAGSVRIETPEQHKRWIERYAKQGG
jgi:cytochrome c oxidase subunit 2